MKSYIRYLLVMKSNYDIYGMDPLIYYRCLLLDQSKCCVVIFAYLSVVVSVCPWLDKSNSRVLTGDR